MELWFFWEKKKRQYSKIPSLSIQILQYEFLGPIPLVEWGPPMEKLVYLILSRDKDKFNIIYAGQCEKTEEKSYFVQHSQFQCWIKQTGSEKSLYLAILPMFDSSDIQRQNVLTRIIQRYKPSCNADVVEPKPDYAVRESEPEKISCACCGAEMIFEKKLEKSTLYRCTSCGISDTRLNS